MIIAKKLDPVIIFSFSKKEVEAHAVGLIDHDLNGIDDKQIVEEIFNNAMESLSEEDRELP